MPESSFHWDTTLWGQFGAAVEMLENAIAACPDEVWYDGKPPRAYWYLVFHTLFFLDLYLYGTDQGFVPPPPFTRDELDPAGVWPERPYTRDELQGYLRDCREKARTAILGLTPERAARQCQTAWLTTSYGDLLLRTLRHIQHHTAQLNWILREKTGSAPGWIGLATT